MDISNVLQAVLRHGLMPQLGDDETRIEKLAAAADAVAGQLAGAERALLPSAVEAALDEDGDVTSPALTAAEDAVRANWVMFANAFPDRPVGALRAVLLDAIVRAARRDDQLAAATWYIARTVTETKSIGAWGVVVDAVLEELGATARRLADAVWAPPSSAASLRMPKIEDPPAVQLPLDVARSAAAFEPPSYSTFGTEFAPLFAKTVNTLVQLSANAGNAAQVNTMASMRATVKALGERLREALEAHEAMVRASALRSDLLWWRFTLYSESRHSPYRDLLPADAAVAAATDLHRLSPPVAPVAVEHLLHEAVSAVDVDDVTRGDTLTGGDAVSAARASVLAFRRLQSERLLTGSSSSG